MTLNYNNLLTELNSYVPDKRKHRVIENTAVNSITSLINVMNHINESLTEEESQDLLNKLVLSIKTKNPDKFINKLRLLEKNREI